MKRVFLIGNPLGHSVSPLMQNAAFRAVGLDWKYELLETSSDEIAKVITRLRADDCVGANVTIPHKETVVKLLDAMSDRARQTGAVNTIIKRDAKLIGENTDCYGFAQAMRDAEVVLQNKRVAILGAGGAAHAVAVTAAELGAARLVILNRTLARARLLAEFLRPRFPNTVIAVNDENALANAHLIVNATSVGAPPRVDESPMPITFPRHAVAVDLVYRPAETRFLQEASRAGARTIGGMSILVHQGAAAFNVWTRRAAPVDVMFQVAEAALRETEQAARYTLGVLRVSS